MFIIHDNQLLLVMATNVYLKDDYADKLEEIQDALPVESSYAQITRKGIDMMYDEFVNCPEEGE